MNRYFSSSLGFVFVFLLALTWLVPNHYWPWVGFHADLWIAACLSLWALFQILLQKTDLSLRRDSIALLLFAIAPALQFLLGRIYFVGDMLVVSLYLFGLFFIFTVASGVKKEDDRYQLIDSLFSAIAASALLSVGLQLCQWFGLVESLEIWGIDSGGGRPGANFAQPNNLSTFLLWGVIAFYWFWVRRRISAMVSMFAIFYLLLGVALTQSRTSILAVGLVIALLTRWRGRADGTRVLLAAVCCFVWLLIWVKMTPLVGQFAPQGMLAERFSDAERVFKDPIRFSIYKGLLVASMQKPWLGFGFDGVGEAFFSVAEIFPPLGVVVLHSHNLFLDLVIWLGWPIGLLCSLLLIKWFISRYLDSLTQERQVLFIFIFVVSLHAMLELPLHYAVFLFPTGLVAGVLSRKDNQIRAFRIPYWLSGMMICSLAFCAVLVARDYLIVEERITSLRLSRYNILSKNSSDSDSIVLLNQFSSFLEFSKSNPSNKVEENDIDLGERVMSIGFNPLNLLHFIEMLAVAGREGEAKLWMRKATAMVGESLYEDMGKQWVRDSERLVALRNVAWIPYATLHGNN